MSFTNIAILLLGTLFLVSCDKSDSDLNPEQILEPGKQGTVVTDKPVFSMSFDGDLSIEEVQGQYDAAYSEFKSKNNIAGRTQAKGDITLGILVNTGTRAGGTCRNAELWWTAWVNGQYFQGRIPNNPMTTTPGWHGMSLIIRPSVGSFASISHGSLWHRGNDTWDVRGYYAYITAEGGIGASYFNQPFYTLIPAGTGWTELKTGFGIGVGEVDVYPNE